VLPGVHDSALGVDRMLLSDTGVAFITDGTTVVAFNVASLAPVWTYASQGGTLSLVAASSDGRDSQ